MEVRQITITKISDTERHVIERDKFQNVIYEYTEKTQKVLKFVYPHDKTDELKTVLTNNNIQYIAYDTDHSYPAEFVVLKDKRTWKEIKSIINSVKAPVYQYYTETIRRYQDGKLTIVDCSVIYI